MPITKEEARVLVSFDREIIPNDRERYRKELFHLLRIALHLDECSHQLSFISLDPRIAGLVKIKLDKLVDAHLHRAFEDYYKLLQEMEKENG